MRQACSPMSMSMQVRAVMTNDTEAIGSDGKPRLSLDECWRLGASNEALHHALAEALHWLETPAADEDISPISSISPEDGGKADGGGEGEGGAQWGRLLRLANLTQAEVDSGLRNPADGDAALLGSAFVDVQARRGREAHAQLAFDELIATVRAEDPTLAAEEARKQRHVLWLHLLWLNLLWLHGLWLHSLWLHSLWLLTVAALTVAALTVATLIMATLHYGYTYHGFTSP